jgi:hypothetical protein
MQATTSRALAFVATVLGFVGLALSLLGGPLGFVGAALAGVALLVLLSIAWLAFEAPGRQRVVGQTVAEAAPVPEAMPEANLDFEYAEPDLFPDEEPEGEQEPMPVPEAPTIDLDSPLQRALAGLPPKPPAPGRYSPRMPVIPEEEPEDEPVRRARRLVPSGQTLGEKRDQARKAKARPPEELEFTVVPAKPRVRPAVLPTQQVPLVVARAAGKGTPPPDLARGKCGGCGTLLWAPKTRPLNLRCPACDKITLLK